MNRASPVVVARSGPWALMSLSVCGLGLAAIDPPMPMPTPMTLPNAVVSGSRPSPYGFCIPPERCEELRRHHSIAVWLDRPMTTAEFCESRFATPAELPLLLAFNREFGHEVMAEKLDEFRAGIPIWLPPFERNADTCCVWVWSLRDGWVTVQHDYYHLRDVVPTYAHPASDSGSIDLRLFPIPVAAQREWRKVARVRPPNQVDEAFLRPLAAKDRDVLTSLFAVRTDPAYSFSFGQWVGERSKVARTIITLPIAEVEGQPRFTETPTVRHLDAYGNDTPPYEPPSSSLAQILVSTTGGAVLAYLFFATRRRKQGAPS